MHSAARLFGRVSATRPVLAPCANLLPPAAPSRCPALMVGCPCDTSRLGCRTASILSYDCVLLDSLLNWGAIVFTMLGGVLLLAGGSTLNTSLAHFTCATAFYWAFQLGLCLLLNDETDFYGSRCTGVSIVWSAQVGRFCRKQLALPLTGWLSGRSGGSYSDPISRSGRRMN